jgi:uncharacterized protein (TIGR02466 family)
MKINKELFFPTPVYFIDLEDSESLNLFLKNRIYSWRDQDSQGVVRSNAKRAGAWHSATTMNQRAEYELFWRQIDGHMNSIFADQQYSHEYLAHCHNMWANINPQGGYNRSHTHPGSLWSGVYYVQTPPDCGRILFQDPRVQAHTMMSQKDENAESGVEQWQEVYHQAIAGRLIIFPSWLRHEVEANLSPIDGPMGDRISISFNYGQILGSSTP